jgi:hypothetical protein
VTAGIDKPALTGKQAAFVDAYLGSARFNATEACRLAGYKGSRITLRAVGSDNLAKPPIQAAIRERLAERAMSSAEVLSRLSEQARGDIRDVITIVPGGVDRDRWVRDLISALKGSGLVQRARPSGDSEEDEAVADTPEGFADEMREAGRQASIRKVSELLGKEPQEPGWRVDLEKAEQLGVTHLVRKISYDREGRPELELYDAQAALVQLGRHHALFVDRSQVDAPEALGLLRQMLGVGSVDAAALPDVSPGKPPALPAAVEDGD